MSSKDRMRAAQAKVAHVVDLLDSAERKQRFIDDELVTPCFYFRPHANGTTGSVCFGHPGLRIGSERLQPEEAELLHRLSSMVQKRLLKEHRAGLAGILSAIEGATA